MVVVLGTLVVVVVVVVVLVDVNNQVERVLSFVVFVIVFVSAEFGLPLVYAKKTDFFGQSVTTLMPEFSMYNFIAINIRLLIAGFIVSLRLIHSGEKVKKAEK